jgi:hypothetical protein
VEKLDHIFFGAFPVIAFVKGDHRWMKPLKKINTREQASLLLSIRGCRNEARVQNSFFTQVDASAD